MKKERESWIEEVVESAANIQRVKADESLYDRIQLRLKGKVRSLDYVSSPRVWLVAAGIALLLALNVTAITYAAMQKSGPVHSSSLTENGFDIYSN